MLTATQLLIVTISSVVAVTLKTLRWDDKGQSGNRSEQKSLMRIHEEPCYAVMLSAVFQQRCRKIVFLKAS